MDRRQDQSGVIFWLFVQEVDLYLCVCDTRETWIVRFVYYFHQQKLVAAICDAQVDQLQQRMVRQKSQRFLRASTKRWGLSLFYTQYVPVQRGGAYPFCTCPIIWWVEFTFKWLTTLSSFRLSFLFGGGVIGRPFTKAWKCLSLITFFKEGKALRL